MSRRRPTLAAYVRRRWRAVGAIAVLLVGALLVLGITDRGHDPAWEARTGVVDQLDVAPDGSRVYTLVRDGDALTRLEARSGETGDVLWESPLSAPRALLRAAGDGVVVATDFPLAFLTHFGSDGGVLLQVPLEGNPRALATDGGRIALALQAPGNPVLVFEGGALARSHSAPTFVTAFDARGGRIALGGGGGEILVFDDEGREVHNGTLAMSVRSLRLSADGHSVAVGGTGRASGDLTGRVAYLDLTRAAPLAWARQTPSGVGLVDVDLAGQALLAVEEAPPTATLHLFEGATGEVRWQRELSGNVARDDAGSYGGAELAPDGSTAAVASLRGHLRVLDGATGRDVWAYRASGANVVAYADAEPDAFVAATRLVASRPYDTLVLFSTGEEPALSRAPVLAGVLAAVAFASLVAIVGLGFWRARRSY